MSSPLPSGPGARAPRLITRSLALCAAINLSGALLFAPPLPLGRQLLGLPEPHPFYLLLLSAWILAFGVALGWQAHTARLDLGVIALSIWGKSVFGLALLTLTARGQASLLAGFGAIVDLLLAAGLALVIRWYYHTRARVRPS